MSDTEITHDKFLKYKEKNMQDDKPLAFALLIYIALGYGIHRGLELLLGGDEVATLLAGLYSVIGIFWLEKFEDIYCRIFKNRGRPKDGPD